MMMMILTYVQLEKEACFRRYLVTVPNLTVLVNDCGSTTHSLMTRRQLLSVASAPHDDHVPLHSVPHLFPAGCCSIANLLYPCLSRATRKSSPSLHQFTPDFITVTCFKAWCAGTLLSSLTTCPNSAWLYQED